jgi:two-component system, OmpR family, sensor histidine kinase TctE
MTWHLKSLKKALFVWLVLPLVVLTFINAFFSYKNAVDAANDAYDRSLYIAARTVAEEIKLVDGALRVDVPQSATYLFENNIGSRFFYEVMDFKGKHLVGNARLPEPETLPRNNVNYFSLVSFYDQRLDDRPIRLAVLKHSLVESSNAKSRPDVKGLLTIKVAETLEARKTLISHILRELLTGQTLLLIALTGLIWLAINKSLKPINGLSQSLESREESDLSIIDSQGVPKELVQLIESLNIYLSRLTNLVNLRKIFIGNAAHQLRTPWAIVKTQIGLAKKEMMNEELSKIIDGLSKTTDTSVRLTEQLLSMTKAEHGYEIDLSKEVDLVGLSKQLVIDSYAYAQKLGIDLGVDIQVAHLRIQGSEVLLSECIGNLLDNAIRYCPRGSHVTIKLDQRSLSVIDDGPGIPSQYQNKIFNRFFRGDSKEPGSGLGLSIVKEIALQHGLRVHLESPYTLDCETYQSGTKISLILST